MNERRVQTKDVSKCRHLWQPYANEYRIWQVCTKCGAKEPVTTHAQQRRDSILYVMGRCG